MKVSLDLSVLCDTSGFDFLDELAGLLQTGRHRWIFDEADLEAIEASPWLTAEPDSRAGRRHQELFRKTAKAAIESRGAEAREPHSSDPASQAHALTIAVGGADGVSLSDGLAQLQCPAELFVEDDISDRRFIRTLVKVFERGELRQAINEGWMVITHCGGKGGIVPRAERLLGDTVARPDRVATLLDSDRAHPDHRSSSFDIAERLEEIGIRVIVLAKREAENYLPLAALDLARQKSTYRAFRDRLTPTQQDHFDMKGGFVSVTATDARGRKRTRPKVPRAHGGLYDDLPEGVCANLVGGFGDHCGQLFERAEVTREGLEARCRHDRSGSELLGILRTLETMI